MKIREISVDPYGGWRPGFHCFAPTTDAFGETQREEYLVIRHTKVGLHGWLEAVLISELFVGNGVYFDPETNLSVFPCEGAEDTPL